MYHVDKIQNDGIILKNQVSLYSRISKSSVDPKGQAGPTTRASNELLRGKLNFEEEKLSLGWSRTPIWRPSSWVESAQAHYCHPSLAAALL